MFVRDVLHTCNKILSDAIEVIKIKYIELSSLNSRLDMHDKNTSQSLKYPTN